MIAHFPRIAVRSGGFSLVEVALALGVVGVVLACIAGVWPSGQDRLKDAIDMTIAAQLAQRLSAEVEVAEFPDVLRLAGMEDRNSPAMGALPRRYFSYTGREVMEDDPARIYEVLTRVVHRDQLPLQAGSGATRWSAQGQVVLTIEVVASPAGMRTPVGADGLVDRAQCKHAMAAFPVIVGGNASW